MKIMQTKNFICIGNVRVNIANILYYKLTPDGIMVLLRDGERLIWEHKEHELKIALAYLDNNLLLEQHNESTM